MCVQSRSGYEALREGTYIYMHCMYGKVYIMSITPEHLGTLQVPVKTIVLNNDYQVTFDFYYKHCSNSRLITCLVWGQPPTSVESGDIHICSY